MDNMGLLDNNKGNGEYNNHNNHNIHSIHRGNLCHMVIRHIQAMAIKAMGIKAIQHNPFLMDILVIRAFRHNPAITIHSINNIHSTPTIPIHTMGRPRDRIVTRIFSSWRYSQRLVPALLF